MAEINNKNFVCHKCSRVFETNNGLRAHIRHHKLGNEKLIDKNYILKREANRRSVQLHRKNNPKPKYDDLENETRTMYKEVEMVETFLREFLGLNIQNSINDKLKEFDEFKGLLD